MVRFRITAPVPGITTSIVGVPFVDSVAEIGDDKPSTLAYFRRQGYTVEEILPAGPERPSKAGTKKEWVAYAVSRGVAQEAAESLTRDQLAEQIDELIARAAAAESQNGGQD